MSYYSKHREELLAYQKEYNKMNKDKIKEYHEEYDKEYRPEYYYANQDKINKQKRDYYKKNKKDVIPTGPRKDYNSDKLSRRKKKELLLEKETLVLEVPQPIVLEIPEPFNDFKINSKGNFYLSW